MEMSSPGRSSHTFISTYSWTVSVVHKQAGMTEMEIANKRMDENNLSMQVRMHCCLCGTLRIAKLMKTLVLAKPSPIAEFAKAHLASPARWRAPLLGKTLEPKAVRHADDLKRGVSCGVHQKSLRIPIMPPRELGPMLARFFFRSSAAPLGSRTL